MEQLSIGLLGSDEIEIKAVLAFNSFLKKPVRIMNIEEVEFAPLIWKRWKEGLELPATS